MHRWPVALGFALAIAAVFLGHASGADRVEDWQLAARWTARVGFPVFLITYCASALYRLWPTDLSRAILQNRRWWGLGFAASHTVHLFALVTYLTISGEPRSLVSLIPGGFAYLVLYTMALTSNRTAMLVLGKNWKRLHSFGIHYLWLIFTLAYAGRIVEPGKQVEGVIAVALSLAALVLRIAAWRKRARQ